MVSTSCSGTRRGVSETERRPQALTPYVKFLLLQGPILMLL